MHRIFLSLSLFLLISSACAMEEIIGIVKNSSYFVENNEERNATFYSCDGEELAVISYKKSYLEVIWQLDPDAPKPQPHYFKIENGTAFKREQEPELNDINGFFATFFDKHGNNIVSYRCASNETLSKAEWRTVEKDLDIIQVKG